MKDAVRGVFCTTTDAVGALAELVGDASEGAPVVGGALGGLADMAENLRGIACNVPPTTDNLPPAPFQGGQCETAYTFNAQFQVDGVNQGPNAGYSAVGPISTANAQFGPDEERPPEFGGGTSSQFSVISNITDGAANVVTLGGANWNPGDPERSSRYVITNMMRSDGQPDDCGNPGPDIPPYNPGDFTDTPQVDYDDDDGNPITINPTIVLAPVFVDVSGEIKIPVNINFDDGSQLFGDVNLSTGDIDFNFGNGPGDCQEPQPVRDDDSVEGDEPADPDENNIDPIVAVLVKVVSIDPGAKVTEIASENNFSNLFVPRLAWGSFQCLIEDGGGLGWSVDFDVRQRVQIVECPVSWGARFVNVTAQPGVSITYVALRGKTTRQLLLEKSNP